MKPDVKCGLCILEWVYGRAISQNGKDIPQLFTGIAKLILHEIEASSNVGHLCNRAVELTYEFISPQSDFWEIIKAKTNEHVKDLLPQAEAYMKKAKTPRQKFFRACRLAATGNVSPLGAPSEAFVFPEASALMEGKGPLPAVLGNVYDAVLKARRVLYITDNAGEIGFDSVLVAQLKEMGLHVTVLVKEPAYFEDATRADAAYFGIDRRADEIVTVSKVFVPAEGRPDADRAYRKSDLLIVKGTGNFEALRGHAQGKPAIYLLKIKCNPVAMEVGIRKGRFVVSLDT
jgi:damage-control phosphatase, subfamily I